ncbi:jg5626 [Pararge aegeria aegeria]|uniref:Jg5626 protein n=1 Tax=Pararge aegeria aegeria TaxID=348720 RepID=A0A8S4QR75_9NEOP|nr:jg5626 [Pararge aegeria aegeria]
MVCRSTERCGARECERAAARLTAQARGRSSGRGCSRRSVVAANVCWCSGGAAHARAGRAPPASPPPPLHPGPRWLLRALRGAGARRRRNLRLPR